MMRQDVKLLSYRLLGAALRAVTAPGWQLLVVGDGPARAEVEAPGRAASGGRGSPAPSPRRPCRRSMRRPT